MFGFFNIMDIPSKADFKYSLKNIPLPSEDSYLRSLIYQCEKVVQRIRWRVFFFFKDKCHKQQRPQQETYGFKTPNNAPQSQLLTNFENDLTHLISNLEFRTINSQFQKTLQKDVNKINKSRNVFVPADKTTNVYEVTSKQYKTLLNNNVTSHYEVAKEGTEHSVNRQARTITSMLGISDRVEPIAHKEAYITLKDHKEGFPNNIKCRLINPAKSNVGAIGKQLLQEINDKIRQNLGLNQWRNTQQVVDWFSELSNKNKLTFMQLDICDFYPSISKSLFNDAINFAKQTVPICNETIEILNNARQSLLFTNDKVWIKKTGLFDVTMGSFDGCEVCELVGLLILSKMKENFPQINFGLYRDDGLGVHTKIPGPQLDRIRKDIIRTFGDMGLKITIQLKMMVVDFLDVSFNLQNGSYKPYRKPNDYPLYINTQSNHPRCVLNQVAQSVNTRLNSVSSNENVFNDAKKDYIEALHKSGHAPKFTFIPKTTNQNKEQKKKRQRRKNVIWFNPPFNKALKTNLGREFLKLLDKNFPVSNQLHQVLNRCTVKTSYCCTPNMAQIIQKHNNKLLKTTGEQQKDKKCNCRNKEACPVDNNCLEECVVYKATVLNNATGTEAEYIGITDLPFKTRYNNHTHSFRNETKKHSTTLSSYVWENNLNPNPNIKWEILKKCHRYQPGQQQCDLCLSEKVYILQNSRNPKSVNKRTDIGNKCTLHKNKRALCFYNT